MNILIADDDYDDCIFFKDALEELQISNHLRVVHDGEQLMHLLSDETKKLPHILFLDLNMPRKNGIECLIEIKQNERLKDLPVVIFSTSNSRDIISKVFRIGAHVYIRKPGDFSQLKQVIHHALPITAENMISGKGSFQKRNELKYILNA